MDGMSRAGAGCLLVGTGIGLVSVLVQTTLSDSAGDQAVALLGHRGRMETGLVLNIAATVLVIAGVVWFTRLTHRVAPRLALVAGILGVFGYLAVLFDDALSAASAAAVRGLDVGQATSVVDRIGSGALVAPGPLTIFGDIGLGLLGLAAVRLGVAWWAAAAIDVGALAQFAGFGAGSRALAAVGFAVLLFGLAMVVRTALGAPSVRREAVAAQPA